MIDTSPGYPLVSAELVLLITFGVFAIGIFGLLTRRNILVLFMIAEMLFNAVNLLFVFFSRRWGNVYHVMEGQIMVFFVMGVAAAEVAVGLALVIALFRNYRTTDVENIHDLKG